MDTAPYCSGKERPSHGPSLTPVQPGLSVVVITLNEAQNIEACLQSVAWADERIVVDAQSVDATVALAARQSALVLVRPWPGYGSQKNFGIEQAGKEWVLILDADERVSLSLRQEIEEVLQRSPDVVGYEMPRRNFFYGHWIRSGGMWPDYQLRLFRRSAGRYDDALLHERLLLNGKVARLNGALDHHSMPTVGSHVRKMMRYTTLGSREKLKGTSRIRWWQLGCNHVVTALKTYLLRGGYRDGLPGLVVALFAGMHTFVKYAKAWEQLHAKPKS
jgi:(heptosyl)LPS beta-1,4-glucosyltransferase